MDADYDESSQITLNENRGKKKSSFSKALHTAKPTFDPGKDIMVFHGLSGLLLEQTPCWTHGV